MACVGLLSIIVASTIVLVALIVWMKQAIGGAT